ncbi:hypothetical protein HZS_7179, partial [Henneguya salminicola]
MEMDEEVYVDINVIYKIVQNLMDVNKIEISFTSGSLVGIPRDNLIEITNCFQFPRKNYENYNTEMARKLEKQDYENMIVGLYTAVALDSFVSEDFITKLHMYQLSIKECVVLVIDYVKLCSGLVSIKAYRLTQSFINLISSKNYSPSNLEKFGACYYNILSEIPVKIRISELSRILLRKLQPQTKYLFDYLSFDQDALITKKFYYLLKYLKDMAQEMHRVQNTLKQIQNHYNFIEESNESENVRPLDGAGQDQIGTESPSVPSIDLLNHLINTWSVSYS